MAETTSVFRAPAARVAPPMRPGQMKFVVVNGRTPRPQSFCTLCCEPIADSYLREVETRLSYCDHECYFAHCGLAVPAL
jgi:hypothetical protein